MPLFGSILVPIDGSDQSAVATDIALELASAQRAAVTFLNVVESDKIIASIVPGQGYADPTLAVDMLRKSGAELLAAAVAKAANAGVKATSKLVEGDTTESILDTAQKENVDLIVVGSHGRTGLERLMLGSVAEGVARHSPVPVMIARLKTEK